MDKFSRILNFGFVLLICGFIEYAKGEDTNDCLDCSIPFLECTNTGDGPVLANAHDTNLVTPRTHDAARYGLDCVPKQYNLTGNVEESICFPQADSIVINIRKYNRRDYSEGERLICKACFDHRGCEHSDMYNLFNAAAQQSLQKKVLGYIQCFIYISSFSINRL